MVLPKISKISNADELEALATQARTASELLKALSHETRLLILCLLSEREMSVSEIEELVQLPQATVSQQLARLRLDKLVTTRREGRVIHYRISDSDVKTIIESLYDLFCIIICIHENVISSNIPNRTVSSWACNDCRTTICTSCTTCY